MTPDPETQELRLEQARRARAELEQAANADDEQETATHEARADKAAYLKEKLEERARAEDT